jgi:uncharacterized protein DUF5995
MRRVGLATAVTVIALGAGASSSAAAGLPQGYVPWPDLLPGRTVGPSAPPHSVPGCKDLRIDCVDRLIVRLRRQYHSQERTCDHRVIFSLGYLRITQEIRRRLAHHETFRWPAWFISVVQGFSDEFFATQRRFDAGKQVPGAWRVYYESMARGDDNAGQDLLLASNAHTNHDLPYAYAASGLLTPKGVSRKHDHDQVNDVNATVFHDIAHTYADRYDPMFSLINTTEPLDALGTLQLVQLWRENAWREAERLVSAQTKAQLHKVEQQIETTSTAWAKLITSGAFPGYRAQRDAYCQAHHTAG